MKINSSWNKDTHQLLLRIYDDNDILQDEKYVKIREGVVDGRLDGKTLRLKLNSGESVDIDVDPFINNSELQNAIDAKADEMKQKFLEYFEREVTFKIYDALATFSVDTNENYIQDTYDVPCCRPDLEGADTQFEFNLNTYDRLNELGKLSTIGAYSIATKRGEEYEGQYILTALNSQNIPVSTAEIDTGMHSAFVLNKDLAEEEVYPEDIFKAVQYIDGEIANKTIDATKNTITNLSSYSLTDQEELVRVGALDEAVNDVLEEATKASKATAEEYTDNQVADAFNDVECNDEEIIFKTKGGQTKTLILKPYATDKEVAEAITTMCDKSAEFARLEAYNDMTDYFNGIFTRIGDDLYVKMNSRWKRVAMANDEVYDESCCNGKLYEHYIYIHYSNDSYCTLVIRDSRCEEFNLVTLAKWLKGNGFTNPNFAYKAFGAHGSNTYYVATLARKEAGTQLKVVNHINYIYSEDGETIKYNTDNSPDMQIIDPMFTDKVRRLI